MKHYDVVISGTGSVLNIITPLLNSQPDLTFAIIENEAIGGICLTRGCIPSKLLLYHADMVRTVERAKDFHINAEIKNVNFKAIMNEMRDSISSESLQIEEGLKAHPKIDLYKGIGEFVGDYKIKIGDEIITGYKFIIASGSRPYIPPIKNIEKVEYLTSKTLLNLKELPKSITIIGGGYIAAELGHFLAAMGSKVTIIGRNRQFIPSEEPEVSELLKAELSKHMQILTGFEVTEVSKDNGKKIITARDRETNEIKEFHADEILVATGRASNADLLKPEKTGVKTDKKGWIIVNEYLETTKPNIWALGDATGKYLFKHVANFES